MTRQRQKNQMVPAPSQGGATAGPNGGLGGSVYLYLGKSPVAATNFLVLVKQFEA